MVCTYVPGLAEDAEECSGEDEEAKICKVLRTFSASSLCWIFKRTVTSLVYVASLPFICFHLWKNKLLFASSSICLVSMSCTTALSISRWGANPFHAPPAQQKREIESRWRSLITLLQSCSFSPNCSTSCFTVSHPVAPWMIERRFVVTLMSHVIQEWYSRRWGGRARHQKGGLKA